ncbi:MAG TPA: glycosyltransferase family 9 protein [Candidatus Nanoarchaeia archaeon]|nr:glycosyltransferase family 9 protein [Candidatus Nanoarchaeia archaeon]
METSKQPKKILVFKIGALGDVLMSTPLVRQLRENFPKAEIVYYVGKYAEPILRGNKNITRIETFDQNLFFRKNIFKAASLRNRITKENFDVAFVLDKHGIFGLFMKLCNIPVRVGFDRNGSGRFYTHKIVYQQAQHEITYYLSLLESFGVKPDYKDTDMDLSLSKKDTAFADSFFSQNKLTGKTIGMLVGGGGDNPGESGSIRRWSTHKYIELIQELSKNYKIVLLGGPKDKELNEDVMKYLKNANIINAAGDANISQSTAIMKKCAVIVTHDSGPMHIAAAVNKKIVSLFGPTNPKRKAPLHTTSIALWKDQEIYEESYEQYGKLPDPEKKDQWMKKITVKEVEQAVRKLISS